MQALGEMCGYMLNTPHAECIGHKCTIDMIKYGIKVDMPC